ncbi:hypothetical protein NBRC116188_16160 [Oceaniserpentilla sp. 4NH20-0058]|uniref:Hpt domain-containing protein n=1 Tax=Oceaniserpentilla sp. 4NH20-0058 TaxID=3127660 RepID=UPI00310B74D9
MPCLDMAQIQELKDIMEDAFDDLVITYLHDCEQKLSSLDLAIKDSESNKIAELAHSIKGASSNICATDLAELCKKVEDSGRADELAKVPEYYHQILEEFQQVKLQLSEART